MNICAGPPNYHPDDATEDLLQSSKEQKRDRKEWPTLVYRSRFLQTTAASRGDERIIIKLITYEVH